jgi:hypothetical protein
MTLIGAISTLLDVLVLVACLKLLFLGKSGRRFWVLLIFAMLSAVISLCTEMQYWLHLIDPSMITLDSYMVLRELQRICTGMTFIGAGLMMRARMSSHKFIE